MSMLSPREALGAALLRPDAPLGADLLAACDEADWRWLDERFEEHRCKPLAAARLGSADIAQQVPAAILADWQAARRAATLDNLHQQQVLAASIAILAAEGLDACALKGAWLSMFGFPEPGLRPMRDLDLLLRDRDATLAAFRALRAAGYTLLEPHDGDLHALLEERHQLPPLVDPDGEVLVEIHHRQFHGHGIDLGDDPLFWSSRRREMLLGTAVRFPALEPLAVHVLVHAMRDHGFDNGPLTVADLAFLLGHAAFDRSRYDRLVEQHALVAEARLADRLVRGEQGADTAAAWRLMLAPGASVRELRQRGALRRAGARDLFSRLFPSPRRLAARGNHGNGLPGLVRAYADHFKRLLFVRRGELGRDIAPELRAARAAIDSTLTDRA